MDGCVLTDRLSFVVHSQMASGTYLLPTRRALFLTIFKSQFRNSSLWYLLETVVVLNTSGTELVEALLHVQRVFEDVGAD